MSAQQPDVVDAVLAGARPCADAGVPGPAARGERLRARAPLPGGAPVPVRLLELGAIAPTIAAQLPLDRADEAHCMMATGVAGKIVLLPADGR